MALILMFSAATGIAAAAPPEPCTVEVSIDDPYIEASVNATDPGAASTSGTVTATTPTGLERATISLTAIVDTGWVISISPQTIQVSGSVGRTSQFTLAVGVPAAEPVSSGIVTVVARMHVAGLQCSSSPVHEPTVAVLPYVESVTLTPSQTTYAISGSTSSRTVTIALGSLANTVVHVDLRYTAPEGVRVDGPSSLSFARRDDGTANTTFNLRIRPDDLELGSYPITVDAVASAGGSEQVEARATFSVEVQDEPLPGPGSAAALFALVAVAGAWGVIRRARR